MKIGIDASELRPGAVGGVRTALKLLFDALHRHAPELDVTAVASGAVEVPPGVKTLDTGGPARPLFWRRSRPLRAALRGFDLFHSPVTAFPADGPVRTATVHELPFVVNHRLEGSKRALAQWYWLSRAMGACAGLVAPSEATLRQVRLAHPAAARVTRVVPHPAPPTPACEQHGHDGSLLFVGRLDQRKCIHALLEGAREFEGQVRLVGPQSARARLALEEAARRLGIHERVLFMGVVDDDTLDYLYRNACVVGLVSASEGFGFPVLEALARSVPVLVAEGTGAAEVAGDAGIRVDPRAAETIAAGLRRAADPEFRRHVAQRGPARALHFTAERTARGYARFFADALDR